MEKKYFILIIGIISLIVLNSGCTSSSTANEFKVGNSTFELTGDWENGFNSNGSMASKTRVDSSNQTITVTQYKSTELYQVDTKHAVSTKKINGTVCKLIPGIPAVVWFKKEGKYFSIGVQNIDSSGNTEDGTSDDMKYIEEIISTLQ